jgi:hypothetical protein
MAAVVVVVDVDVAEGVDVVEGVELGGVGMWVVRAEVSIAWQRPL